MNRKMNRIWPPGRIAFIALADELDPHGVTHPATLDEMDPDWVRIARIYAEQNYLPFPYTLGIDAALVDLAGLPDDIRYCDVCEEPLKGEIAEVVRNDDPGLRDPSVNATVAHLIVHEACFDRERMTLA